MLRALVFVLAACVLALIVLLLLALRRRNGIPVREVEIVPLEARAQPEIEPVPVPASRTHAVAPEEEIVFAEDLELDEEEPARLLLDRCDIAYWHGYRKGLFYARVHDERGTEFALVESPPFRATGNGIPDRNDEAQHALALLIALLRDQGWQPNGMNGSSAWYAHTLHRAE